MKPRALIVRGDGADSFLPHEQCWVLHDDLNDVLATTTHPPRPDQPWHRPVTSPAVWTRLWGAGRVFGGSLTCDVAP